MVVDLQITAPYSSEERTNNEQARTFRLLDSLIIEIPSKNPSTLMALEEILFIDYCRL